MSKNTDILLQINRERLGETAAYGILLVAISGAAYALYAYSLFQATEAILAAAILFVAAAQIPGWLNSGSRRLRTPGELSDLIKANATLAKKVQVLSQRLDVLSRQQGGAAPADFDKIAEKVGELDQNLQALQSAAEAKPRKKTGLADWRLPMRKSASSTPSKFPMTATTALVDKALGADAVGLFLQPVVTIANRRTMAYEATLKLIGPNGSPFDEPSVQAILRKEALEIHLDRMLLEKVLRVATHFRNRSRNASVICRFSERALADTDFLAYLLDTLVQRKDLAGAIFPAIAQGDLALLSTQALETLAGLHDHGFSFVMDELRDLDAKPDILRRAGFCMIRARSFFFTRADADRDTACLALLASCRQSGVLAIATDVSTELEVRELVNGVEFGQGDLFASPRMVRAELADSGTANITAAAG